MSAFASYASPLTSPNAILPSINTTGTGGSTYKYETVPIHGGRKSTYKSYKKYGGKTHNKSHKNRGNKTHNKKGRKSYKKR
jgi:hypothetical protein